MAAISLGTALAIGAISAGGSVAKGAIQARAAGKAAKQQEAGAKAAAQQMQQGFGTISQLYQPYLARGASVSNTLGRLTTPGAGARYASAGPPPMAPPPQQQGPGTGRALPRMGGMQGPYMMAEGGDMVVDRPTMFIAGEAGPERATFSGGPGARQRAGAYQARPMGGAIGSLMPPRVGAASAVGQPGAGSGDLRSQLMAKYGGARGAPTGGDPRQAAMAAAGGAMGMFGGGRPPMPQGAGGWGGTFAQMGSAMGQRMPPPPQMPPGGFTPQMAPPEGYQPGGLGGPGARRMEPQAMPPGGFSPGGMGGGGSYGGWMRPGGMEQAPPQPQWPQMQPQGWGYY